LHTRATRRNMDARYRVKCRLIRLLYERQWAREWIHQFFLVIDWMMALPPALDIKLNSFISDLEEEQKMEYVSSIERVRSALNLQKGLEEGAQATAFNLLSRLLTRRFGNLPAAILDHIKSATQAQLEAWFDSAIDAKSIDEVFPDLAH
jgi:Domain of unknown function (DUF4351)